MQPIGNRLLPSMLAAGANRKIALVRNLSENEFVQSQRFLFANSFFSFIFIIPPPLPLQMVNFDQLTFKLFNV